MMWHRNRWHALGLCAALLSQTAWGADLAQVYELARINDQQFEAARHAREAGMEKTSQAAAGLLPNINLAANRGRTVGNTAFGDSPYEPRKAFNHGWSLQLVQPLVRFQNWENYFQAEAQEVQVQAQFELSRQELILRSAQAYFDTLGAQESLAVAETQFNAVGQQLGLAQRNFEVGMSTVTDVHEARSRLDLARAQRLAAKNELEVRRADLERVTGESIALLSRLEAAATLPNPQPDTVEDWIVQARTAHPSVQVQQASLEMAQRELSKHRAAHMPTLDLMLSREHNAASGSVSSPLDQASSGQSSQISVQLNLPLFSGGLTNSRIREAVSNRSKTIAELESSRRQAAALARQAFAGVMNGLARSDALAQALLSSQSALEANRIGYRVGVRINIDVLNAEQQLYSTQRDLTLARFETIMQGLKLKASVGNLQEVDLLAINTLLVPTKKETP